MRKRIAILGSTGSIGTQALDIIGKHNQDFEVVALSAHTNISLLAQQVNTFNPEQVTLTDTKSYQKFLKQTIHRAEVHEGIEGIKQMISTIDVDIVLIAIVGIAALEVSHYVLSQGIDIALANKECIVTGGELITSIARETGAKIIPVDSEHSAVFQCLQGCRDSREIENIFLTASGGPFKDYNLSKLQDVTPSQALKHPNWDMGNKVTIDSATLMNKGLEVIEAKWLFDIDVDKIKVVVHPQSIIHSMVEFVDGSVMANIAMPDMRIPILYAFTYPSRLPTDIQFNPYEVGSLEFARPDTDKFPCLKLAYEAIETGGTMPVALNAGNEVAVEKFLKGNIGFMDIPQIVEKAMNIHSNDIIYNPSLQEILDIDRTLKEILV